MKVLKFGGSSLSTPATIREVGRILLDARRREPVIGVVSAFQGVTNQLLECARLAERADSVLRRRVRADRPSPSMPPSSHLIGRRPARVRAQVDTLLAELRSTLQGIHLLRHCPAASARHDGQLRRTAVRLHRRRLSRPHVTPPPSSTRAICSSPTISSRTRTSSSRRRTARTRAYFSRLFRRSAQRRSRSSPASSAPPPMARRRRSGGTDPTTARRSSAPRSAPR